jgi:aspartyl-tRNA synthetase
MGDEEDAASKAMEDVSLGGDGAPKKDRAALKAERAAARGAKQAASVVAEDDPLSGNYGDVALVQSESISGRTWTRVAEFCDSHVGQRVLVRGRVHTVRGKGKSAFLILRQGTSTLQVCVRGCRSAQCCVGQITSFLASLYSPNPPRRLCSS